MFDTIADPRNSFLSDFLLASFHRSIHTSVSAMQVFFEPRNGTILSYHAFICIVQLLLFVTGYWAPTAGQKISPQFPYRDIVVRLLPK